MADQRQPPAQDEVEVSLFGPGVGECIALHCCNGDWIVVDSCVDRPGTAGPAVLRYLRQIGIDPASALRKIVITHWHDDHIRGVSEIVRAAPAAEVICSAALNGIEFFKLVAAAQPGMTPAAGTDEFSQILDLLRERAPKGTRPGAVGFTWANANQRLWQRVPPSNPPAEVFSLSPSAASVTLALRGFAELFPGKGTTKRRLVAPQPNEAAVVLWLSIGSVRVLLGSDLETSPNHAIGWQAIVASGARPVGTAHVFKVPHHGSANADDPAVWTTLLIPNPHAILTPFIRGRGLPTAMDVARITQRTPHRYLTSPSRGWSPPRRETAVEKTLREIGRDRKALTGPVGHIRLRVPHTLSAPVRVDLFDGATPL